MGVLPVTTDAFNAAAVPDPISDLNNWYLNDGDVSEEEVGSGNQWTQKTYDVRTGRRLGAGIDLAFIMENVSGVNALTFTFHSQLFLRLP